MSETIYSAVGVAAVAGFVTLAVLFVMGCYALATVPFLPALRVLRSAAVAGSATVGGAQSEASGAIATIAVRLFRGVTAFLVPERREVRPGQADVLATVVFVACAVASQLVMVAAAPLVGLGGWGGAHDSLIWVLAFTLLGVAAFAYRVRSLDRRLDLPRVTVLVAALALSAFAAQRGVDLVIQWVLEHNALRILPDEPVPFPPAYLLNARAALPAVAFVLAEIALILGAFVSEDGLVGLVAVGRWVLSWIELFVAVFARATWWLVLTLPLVLGGVVLRFIQGCVNALGYTVRGALSLLRLTIDLVTPLPERALRALPAVTQRVSRGGPPALSNGRVVPGQERPAQALEAQRVSQRRRVDAPR